MKKKLQGVVIIKGSRVVMIFSWIIVVLWILLIFILSVQTAEQSAGLSVKVARSIVKMLSWIMPIDNDVMEFDKIVRQFHNIIRKLAHVGLYFVLGGVLSNSFIQIGIKGSKAYRNSLIFCVFYAITDEMHQMVVAGRSGQLSDILIDTVGAIVGISVCWIYIKLWSSRQP